MTEMIQIMPILGSFFTVCLLCICEIGFLLWGEAYSRADDGRFDLIIFAVAPA